MQASVVISYYKNIPNLELILLALNRQTATGIFEVIVSEDDDAIETQNFIITHQHNFSFPIIHLTQADEGFRKCRALNNAIRTATTDFLIFIDGDCIPHKQFVKEYIQNKKPKTALYGRRALLNKKLSETLLQKKDLRQLKFLNLLFSGTKRLEEGLYLPIIPQNFKNKSSGRLLGCNMALNKQDLMAINGFDEDYIAPGGGEDSDIEWRLETLGNISFQSMKFTAIVYHIHHLDRFTKAMELKNNQVLNDKISKGDFICKNGLNKLQ